MSKIFVFGSNLSGIHGAGAALCAYKQGFPKYLGSGLAADCYAIPTKDFSISTLPLSTIALYVQQFLGIAAILKQANIQFQVTRIGCGLAGFKDKDIAPLFRPAPSNCWFDEAWRPWFTDEPDTKYWGTF